MVMMDKLLSLYSGKNGVTRFTLTVRDPLVFAFRKACNLLCNDLGTEYKKTIGLHCWQTAWSLSDWDETWQAAICNSLDYVLKYHPSLINKIVAVKNSVSDLVGRVAMLEDHQKTSNNLLQLNMIQQFKKGMEENNSVCCYGTRQQAAVIASKIGLDFAEAENRFIWKSELWKMEEIIDELIICGPLRFMKIPDMVVTAPRWRKLINIRYEFDRNSSEFGICPENIWQASQNEPKPVNAFWPGIEKQYSIDGCYSENDSNDDSEGSLEGTWNLDQLEKSLFPLSYRNRRTFGENLSTQETETEMVFCFKVLFENEKYLAVPANDEQEPGTLLVLDPIATAEMVREKYVIAERLTDPIEGDHLTYDDEVESVTSGMYFVSLRDAINVLKTISEEDFPEDGIVRSYIEIWKNKLQEKIELDGYEKIARRFHLSSIFYVQSGTVRNWSRDDCYAPCAPGTKDVFDILIKEVLNFDNTFCDNAWEEVRLIRGGHIARGQHDNRTRKDWLLNNLNANSEEISRELEDSDTYTWSKKFVTRSGKQFELKVDLLRIREITEMDYLIPRNECYILKQNSLI